MSVTPELRSHLGAAGDRGVLVERVVPSSPAAAAGVRVGDVVTAVRGEKIADVGDVITALAGSGKNQDVAIELVRDHRAMTVHAKLGDAQPSALTEPPGFDLFRKWLHELDWPHEMPGPHQPTRT